ncbi:MAG: hypothetical protein LUF29_02580 [Oscillospiraceae bacterium]|nr:hypothetical protein [Oscillospiraceae bacterium]
MRKTIFEQLKESMSFSSEIKRLETLIHDEDSIEIRTPKHSYTTALDEFDFYTNHYSLEKFCDTYSFKNWKARGTCISCADMRNTLQLNKIVRSDNPSIEDTINYCEYVTNLLGLHDMAELPPRAKYYDTQTITAVESNLISILDWLNLEAVYFEDEEMTLITEKNAAVTAVAEIVDESLAYQIVMYNHYTLKGDIAKKKGILVHLGNELEASKKSLSSTNSQLNANIFFMLNNLNLRHNNVSIGDKNYKEYTGKMTEENLENWYDELYQMMLLAFLELDQIERNDRIGELKSHYRQC